MGGVALGTRCARAGHVFLSFIFWSKERETGLLLLTSCLAGNFVLFQNCAHIFWGANYLELVCKGACSLSRDKVDPSIPPAHLALPPTRPLDGS